MTSDEEPPLREQLVAARDNILGQLDHLRIRSNPFGSFGRGPPDNRSLIATLEDQLREIEAILAEGPGR